MTMSSDLSLELANVHAAVTRWFTDETHQGFFAVCRAAGVSDMEPP